MLTFDMRHLLLALVTTPINRLRMLAWKVQVARYLADSPGTDEGFSAEQIRQSGEVHFSQLSNWEIVCEEVLDTNHPRSYYVRAREELLRRGFTNSDYREMRRLAWLTAGWLNDAQRRWEWKSLGEGDMLRAIQEMHAEGWICSAERDRWWQQVHANQRGARADC